MSADARAVVAYLDTTLAGGADANAVRNFVRKFGLDDHVSEEDIQNLLRCHGDGGGKLDVRAVEGLLAEHRTVTQQARGCVGRFIGGADLVVCFVPRSVGAVVPELLLPFAPPPAALISSNWHATTTSHAYRQAAQESLQALRDSNNADAGSGVSEADALVAALSDTPAGQGQPPSVSRADAAKLVAGSSGGGNTDGAVDHSKFLALAEAGDQAQQ